MQITFSENLEDKYLMIFIITCVYFIKVNLATYEGSYGNSIQFSFLNHQIQIKLNGSFLKVYVDISGQRVLDNYARIAANSKTRWLPNGTLPWEYWCHQMPRAVRRIQENSVAISRQMCGRNHRLLYLLEQTPNGNGDWYESMHILHKNGHEGWFHNHNDRIIRPFEAVYRRYKRQSLQDQPVIWSGHELSVESSRRSPAVWRFAYEWLYLVTNNDDNKPICLWILHIT